ncbi:hypothetical protein Q9L58_007900 [Maublancomyces gigas]|uniref:Uncharacterized protein n=1 Tax=Discina gigas TaxID=1032678 RepID=A0ABR3GB77_9PEZI
MSEQSNDESSLTTTQREILTELQKILMTLNQINDSLLNTISLTREGGEMRRRQKEATDTGEQVFGKALGNEEERQGEVENMEE